MAGENLREFTDDNFDTEVLASEIPVVADVWAPWCGPCKMQAPIVEELAETFVGRVRIGKLNVDDNPRTAAKYGINSIPTLLFVKNGSVADQHVGLLAKEALKAKIDQFIGS